jgi:transposase
MGAGIARFLARAGVQVVEVDRQNRQARRQSGKSDPLDAVEAARCRLSGRARGVAKSRDGSIEAIRVLVVAKRSARAARVKALAQMRQLTYSAPDQLQCRLKGLPIPKFVSVAQGLRPTRSADPVTAATKASLSSLAHRVADLEDEIEKLDAMITPLLEATAPELLAVYGVGIDTAATLLVAAGNNPERLRSEAAWAHLCGVSPLQASSGKVTRHRLNRGGDRQANRALWHIVMSRLSSDPETKSYMERRVKDGGSKREAIRMLKRYVAREVYRYSRLDPRTMDLAHITPVVLGGLTLSRFAGPWSGFTEFSKTRDLIRACPPQRVAHHWSVRCLFSRKIPPWGLTSSIGASAWGRELSVSLSRLLIFASSTDSGPWRAPAHWSHSAGSQSSVVPTSRTGLPSILAPTWDDPQAGEASKRPTVLIRIPPPTPTKSEAGEYFYRVNWGNLLPIFCRDVLRKSTEA